MKVLKPRPAAASCFILAIAAAPELRVVYSYFQPSWNWMITELRRSSYATTPEAPLRLLYGCISLRAWQLLYRHFIHPTAKDSRPRDQATLARIIRRTTLRGTAAGRIPLPFLRHGDRCRSPRRKH